MRLMKCCKMWLGVGNEHVDQLDQDVRLTFYLQLAQALQCLGVDGRLLGCQSARSMAVYVPILHPDPFSLPGSRYLAHLRLY